MRKFGVRASVAYLGSLDGMGELGDGVDQGHDLILNRGQGWR